MFVPGCEDTKRREGDELRAYSRRCPHLGVDLIDGYHDDGAVFCPGHGIEFSWRDGQSTCGSFRLHAFSAREEGGTVYLSRKAAEQQVQVAAAAG